MHRVLCYGDSLTWGFDPGSGGRFPAEQVWPGVMAEQLGPDVTVIVEALTGRTTVVDSPYAPGRNGATLLRPLLETHWPLDLVILMLGTNDLQVPLDLSARHAASGMWTLIDIAMRSPAAPDGSSPKVLVVAPPHIVAPHGFMGVFYEGRDLESQALGPYYREIAERAGVAHFDASGVTEPGVADGVHLDPAGNAALGTALAGEVRTLLAQ